MQRSASRAHRLVVWNVHGRVVRLAVEKPGELLVQIVNERHRQWQMRRPGLLHYTRNFWDELEVASGMGDRRLVQLLLMSGADADRVTEHGKGALILAAQGGRSDIVKLLLDRLTPATADACGGRAAVVAARDHGRLKVIGLLLAGNMIGLTDDELCEVLVAACGSRQLAIVKHMV
ncbi:uncharacterized protein B0I36DRAFT_85933 [Microdochium trichocladiopsis]|uniref:Ankyrin repeat-containing domain protein n=1 Tax=Microdochium trichocladiopsis TaxID=1682393 RepID=A0A9P8YAJ2_9PEZI|nr:uncharacterized protein B0I36DRAFT_85933 [Microdochium trichocladiopsis]KAH7034943.1 hypothetical protein B0I36DRAFT_85933 [Microdochium trichocladiopsis]